VAFELHAHLARACGPVDYPKNYWVRADKCWGMRMPLATRPTWQVFAFTDPYAIVNARPAPDPVLVVTLPKQLR
jgi:hypothetical protein